MLYDIDTGKQVTTHPYFREFNIWRNRLSQDEFEVIVDQLNSMIDGDEIHTTGWMPGNKWAGTVFEPIYTKACKLYKQKATCSVQYPDRLKGRLM